jgi:DNA polymerase III delta subunit
VSNLVIIHGEEEFLVERAAHEEAALHIPDEIIEYELPNQLNDYLEDSQIVPIIAGRRVYIVKSDKVPDLPIYKDDLLVIIGGKKPIVDPRAKRVLSFPKLKTYDDNNEVLRWILKEGENRNIDLNRVAVGLFLNNGSCLRKLASEIEKLVVLTPSGCQVTPDVARSIMCFSAELTPKSVVDAICEGHAIKALTFYDRLQERHDETGWILAYLQRHVSQQIRSDSLLESGVSPNRAAEIIGMHPYVYLKTFNQRRNLWSVKTLKKSFGSLCDLDILHKQGVDIRCELEIEIITLSETAGKNDNSNVKQQ